MQSVDAVISESETYQKLVTGAAKAAMVAAGLMIVTKLLAWFYTDSASMLASLTDSLLDISASFINLMAIRYALVPADKEHSFGHGKAESLAGLAQSAFISASAIFLMITGISRLLNTQSVSHAGIGIGVILFSILITLALVIYQGAVIRKTSRWPFVPISCTTIRYFIKRWRIAGHRSCLAGFSLGGWLVRAVNWRLHPQRCAKNWL